MILFILLVLLFLIYMYLTVQKVEGFDNDQVFDPFYSYHYDDIFNTIPLYEEMIFKVLPLLTQGSSMLWMGSRNGHGVQLLNDMGKPTGMDGSSAMVKMSRYKYPSNTFLHGDYTQKDLFSPRSFTAVFCPFLELHRVSDLDVLMRNVSDWIVQYGYFVITRIDLSQFSTALLAESPSLNYTSEIKGNEWIETFTQPNSKKLTNKQTLYPYTMQEIAAVAKRYDLKQINQYAGSLVPLQVLVYQKK